MRVYFAHNFEQQLVIAEKIAKKRQARGHLAKQTIKHHYHHYHNHHHLYA